MKFELVLLLVPISAMHAQTGKKAEAARPPLFFREDFRETEAATPITQEHIANPSLLLGVYGPGKAGMKKSHHDTPADDPYYIWNGTCEGNCAASLRHSDSYADLTGLAKIRWRTKQSGFRSLHILLKLANGTWLVSDQADGSSNDWREREFAVQDIRWRQLDIKTVVEGAWVERPDLSRVDEIGWSDLMTGGGTPACSRLDWIEVYGRAVKRQQASRPAASGRF
jgi:hypothetical protein